MKTSFQLTNLLGTVYCRGNLFFSPEGDLLLSPVGNRVTVFDLIHNKSYTLPYAHRRSITSVALSPKGNLLLTVDEDGRAILGHFRRRLALYHFSFGDRVHTVVFSPSGRHFAVGLGRNVEIWHTPSTPDVSSNGEIEYAPFVKHRKYAGHHDDVTSIQWSSDSRFILSASKDLTARIWSLETADKSAAALLSGHKEAVVGAWFSKDQESIFTVSKDGALFQWSFVPKEPQNGEGIEMELDDTERWRVVQRHYFMQSGAKAKCATYHASSNLLVVGFSNGLFGLYELPDFSTLHTLSISNSVIDHVSISKSGEWIAFGASKLGQVVVWEWQSESYILKQQGHFDSITDCAFSPDGQHLVSTADDGKIKLWDVESGFCIVTFTEHTAAVTACAFARKGRVLYTASLDGSIRAWDLIRYRNFRTFTSPSKLPFSDVAIDPSGEVVVASSLESFEIMIWSVQTGQLLDQLAGHEGPISCLDFAPGGDALVTGSWDHTVRIWNIFGRTQTSEPLELMADVVALAVRPDSKQAVISTLDGQLTFWSLSEANQESAIDGRMDISGGRRVSDRFTAANSAGTKSFSKVVYSVDGSCVLAGGNSKYICLYDTTAGMLLRRFTVSVNLALDGTQEYLNSRNLTEAGPLSLIDEDDPDAPIEDRIDKTLPGVNRGDLSERRTRPVIRVSSVAFSPAARSFCAASTEGLAIYSLDNRLEFDPFDLDVSITNSTTLKALAGKQYLQALVMAFRLNDRQIIQRVYEAVPLSDVVHIARALPLVYLTPLLRFVANSASQTPHLEYNLVWIEALLNEHGNHIKQHSANFVPEMRSVQKSLQGVKDDLQRMSDANLYNLDFLLEK